MTQESRVLGAHGRYDLTAALAPKLHGASATPSFGMVPHARTDNEVYKLESQQTRGCTCAATSSAIAVHCANAITVSEFEKWRGKVRSRATSNGFDQRLAQGIIGERSHQDAWCMRGARHAQNGV